MLLNRKCGVDAYCLQKLNTVSRGPHAPAVGGGQAMANVQVFRRTNRLMGGHWPLILCPHILFEEAGDENDITIARNKPYLCHCERLSNTPRTSWVPASCSFLWGQMRRFCGALRGCDCSPKTTDLRCHSQPGLCLRPVFCLRAQKMSLAAVKQLLYTLRYKIYVVSETEDKAH